MLAENGPDAMPVAGGTNLVVDLRAGACHPKALMDLGKLQELRGIRLENGAAGSRPHLVIGACTTLTDVLESQLIAQYTPVLREAAAVFANPLIRNRATVGGNLADASPAADTAPPLLVLEAEVELSTQGGSRWMPLEEFLVGVRKTLLQPHELLTAIRWPVPPSESSGAYHKVGLRKADAISVLSVAVMLTLDESGQCGQARIALGAVAHRPLRAREAEDLLAGQPLDLEVIAEAASLVAKAARPISDIRGSAAYRQRVTEVVARRLLTQAADTPRNNLASGGRR
jgi:carbon-monoxide dehydrogenase medium subunit